MPCSSSTLRRSYGRLTSLRWRTRRETQSSRILWKLLMLGLSCESTFLPRLVQRERVDVWFFALAHPIRFCVDALYHLIVASCLDLQKCRLLLRKRGSCCRLHTSKINLRRENNHWGACDGRTRRCARAPANPDCWLGVEQWSYWCYGSQRILFQKQMESDVVYLRYSWVEHDLYKDEPEECVPLVLVDNITKLCRTDVLGLVATSLHPSPMVLENL